MTKERAEKLKKLNSNEFDVVVVGGGATGVGIALDSQARGFNTLVIDSGDFARSTSSKSTKILHGGVRYLAQGNIDLVFHALRERSRLIKNAKHLCTKIDYVMPAKNLWELIFYGIGLYAYYLLSFTWQLGKTRILSKKELLELYPGLDEKHIYKGILYTDGQFDDSRLNISTVQTIENLGGTCLNYFSFIDFIKKDSKITGIKAKDIETGEEFNINAKVVFNATGCNADILRLMDNKDAGERVKSSQGTHIVLPINFSGNASSALLIPKTADGRVLFAIPWHDRLVVGTTDIPMQDHAIEAVPMKEEVDFILETFNEYSSVKAKKSDIVAIYAGQRPLVAHTAKKRGDDSKTKKLSRDHVVEVSGSNLVSVMGGKWTTYRLMGEAGVNKAIEKGLLPNKLSVTANLRLVGSTKTIKDPFNYVYGDKFDLLEKLDGIDEKLSNKYPFTKAHVIHAVRNEYARKVEDVISRRFRLLFVDANVAIEVAPKVAKIMAEELNWDSEKEQAEVNNFKNLANHYLPI